MTASAVPPLTGWRVLVPRPSAGRSPAEVALAAAGAEAVVVPLIETVPPEDPTELDDALLALESGWFSWLVLTSAAAVPVLVDRAQESAGSLPQLLADGAVRVAAIGPGTARALREVGVEPDLVPRGPSTSRSLVDAWPEPTDPARVLFPRGDLAAATVTEGLHARGWEVTDVVAYRTVAAAPPPADVREAWADGTIHAALLTSASTVRELAAHLGPPPSSTLLIGIGPSTAAEAARLGLPLAGVATEQTMLGMVDALTRAVRTVLPAPIPSPEEL
ncbi:uroporphyrinogen-III synthase [uncultured Cellulomonas sp.]|uniref:uroporphyrinogen-III synthase n=1 Tax=uncultured Cellulomonas sp. TaxID=189682 RepID=UPI0028E222BE|nr:uroporphyrinogen-III synthase [uncultured Cellulomonas sp.]